MAVGVMTNGNADLSGSALDPFLSLSLSAGEVGAAKPSIIPFFACSQRTGIAPSRILFVMFTVSFIRVVVAECSYYW